jgi:hypothetical protein
VIRADVSRGGTIDIRSIPVANVTASVHSGGRIFTRAEASLSAQVEQGGNVTYWGDPIVKSSVRFGGVVVEGSTGDIDRPIADLGLEDPPPVPPTAPVPAIAPVPAVAAVPAVPAIQPKSR